MLHQPWLQFSDWEKRDSRLSELTICPVRLPHGERLLERIPLAEGIFSLLGPRQVGKSTLLRLLAAKALKASAPHRVALIEGDAIESWRELLSLLLDVFKKITSNDRTRRNPSVEGFILIDEITAIAQWHRAIKTLADRGELKKIFLLYTGSSLTSLKEGGEFLPGRRGKHQETTFELLPASYADISDRLSLEEYFHVGGFPWAINEYLRLKSVPPYVGEIYWSWLKGEFLKRGKSDMLLRHVVTSLSRRRGTPLSHTKLAQESGVASHETARQYSALLQDCFAVDELLWMDPHRKVIAPRKNRKYYPIDPLLYHLFCGGGFFTPSHLSLSSSPEEEGFLAEMVVLQELKRQKSSVGYWLGKKEVDFVSSSSPLAIEVKYQNRVIPEEFSWFERTFPKHQLLVLTKNDSFVRDRIKASPLKDWLCENVGKTETRRRR